MLKVKTILKKEKAMIKNHSFFKKKFQIQETLMIKFLKFSEIKQLM